MLVPVKRSRVSDDIMEQLTSQIVSGELACGSKLPAERTLTETFRVNRTTLREALRRMEDLGLISVRTGDGVYVEDFRTNATLDFMKFVLATGIGMDREFISSVAEMLRVFVIAVVERAAKDAGAESLDRMQAAIDDFPGDDAGIQQYVDWSFEFLREVVASTNNRMFMYLLNDIRGVGIHLSFLTMRISGSDTPFREAIGTYQKIVDLLKKGDSRKVVRYVESRMERYDELVPQFMDAIGLPK